MCIRDSARALSLSLVNRGAATLAEGVADNIYECALCGACTKECATGWDPVSFTKDVRLQMALDGMLPEYINCLLYTSMRCVCDLNDVSALRMLRQGSRRSMQPACFRWGLVCR